MQLNQIGEITKCHMPPFKKKNLFRREFEPMDLFIENNCVPSLCFKHLARTSCAPCMWEQYHIEITGRLPNITITRFSDLFKLCMQFLTNDAKMTWRIKIICERRSLFFRSK